MNTIQEDTMTITPPATPPVLSAYEMSKAGRHAEAIAGYKALITASPKVVRYYTSLGWEVYRRLQQIEKASESRSEVDNLLRLASCYARGSQETLYSCLMRIATGCLKTHEEKLDLNLCTAYLEFLEAMDVRRFSDKDRAPFTPEPGKSFPSLCERVASMVHRILKELGKKSPYVTREGALEILQRHDQWLVPFFAECVSRFPSNQWLPYYYGQILLRLGQKVEARNSMLKIVTSKPREFWAWATLGETFEAEPEKQLACLCKALTCDAPTEYTVRVHQKMENLLQKMGLSQEAGIEGQTVRADFYKRHAGQAEEVLLNFQLEGKETRKFSGKLRQREDQPFGFVDDVFIPPPLLKTIDRSREAVSGIAVKDWDAKKQRDGWKAVSLNRG